jgi:hypothetical protein|tara:strand:+ start:42337 stop:43176 length:840 start_codon:yes stop_codon:yes gene_type:complete
MNEDLTPRQRKTLQKISEDLRCSIKKKRDVTATDRKILQWCAAQDLISATEADSPVFVYTKNLLTAINQRLEQLSLAPFEANQAVSSMQQAKQGISETKSVRESPRTHRILTAEKQTQTLSGWQIIDRDYRLIDLNQLEDITVVENLDSFYELERFALEFNFNSLIVYRGDKVYSKGRAALLKHWRATGKPLKYFGDLDVKGFHIAQSEGFSHIAVPEIGWFKIHANTNAFNPKQANLLPSLAMDGPLAEYYRVLKDQHRAILQQWLQKTPLHWCHLRC